MESLLQDLRFGVRFLLRHPGFTWTAVPSLALGIGGVTAIFTLVYGVLLQPLPFRDPDRIVRISNDLVRSGRLHLASSGPEYVDYASRDLPFEKIGAYYRPYFVNLTGAGEPRKLRTAIATASFFSVLGVDAALGRPYLPEEDLTENSLFTVLSHRLWTRAFESDPGVVGKTVTLDGDSVVVVGVMPPGFRFPEPDVDLWLPIAFDPAEPGWRTRRWMTLIARLADGVTLEQAQARMDVVEGQLAGEHPEVYAETGWQVRLVPLKDDLVREVRPALLAFFVFVAFVLLIACTNVANLLLARSTVREAEVAVRAALGAGRSRLIRQLLTESVLLSLAGGALGLLLAWLALRGLSAVGPGDLPRLDEVRLDAAVFTFALLVSALTGIAFGLLPALHAARPDLHPSLKEGGRTSAAAAGSHRLRKLFVVAQIGIALVLLAGAGLMLRSFYKVLQVDPGLITDNVLTMEVAVPYYREPHEVISFYERLVEGLEALPGILGAGVVSHLPFGGRGDVEFFRVDGQPPGADGASLPRADYRSVSPGYLRALGIPLLRGRQFTALDHGEAPRVAIIDEVLARYWQGEDPIGTKMLEGANGDGPQFTVVGVVGHVKHGGLDADSVGQLYLPHRQLPWRDLAVVARTANDPLEQVAAVRTLVREIDPDQPVENVRTLEQVISESFGERRFATMLFAAFAAVALVLATIGVYGVMAYMAAQRSREIGIRMALGARRRDIRGLVVGQGLGLALAGVIFGLAVAAAATRLMSHLLFGVSATDPLVFAGVALVLTGVALLASYFPARRSTRVSPAVVLRSE